MLFCVCFEIELKFVLRYLWRSKSGYLIPQNLIRIPTSTFLGVKYRAGLNGNGEAGGWTSG